MPTTRVPSTTGSSSNPCCLIRRSTSLIGSLGPIFTVWLGYLLLGEAVNATQLAGAALVLGGVTLVTLKPGRA